jgi:hypothetical protein
MSLTLKALARSNFKFVKCFFKPMKMFGDKWPLWPQEGFGFEFTRTNFLTYYLNLLYIFNL